MEKAGRPAAEQAQDAEGPAERRRAAPEQSSQIALAPREQVEANPSSAAEESGAAAPWEEGAKTVMLRVGGMACAACAASIEKGLKRLAGVTGGVRVRDEQHCQSGVQPSHRPGPASYLRPSSLPNLISLSHSS